MAFAGTIPARDWAGASGFSALLAGLGVALAGALAGSAVACWGLYRPAREMVSALMAGLVLRLLATLGAALPLLLSETLPRVPLAISIGLGHMVFLVVDLAGLTALARAGEARAGASSPTSPEVARSALPGRPPA